MSKSSVKVDIEVATKAAEIALKQFQANMKQTDKTWDIFKGNLAAQFTMAGLTKAGQAVLNFAKETVQAASEAEQSSRNLSIALESVGLTSEATFNDLTKYADGLEKVSQYSAEAIQDSTALLAQLTTLDKDGLKQATSSVIDMASALNLDLKTATNLMIQGINGQVTSFRRYGLQVQAGSNATQNFANILEATTKFQGSAEKQTHTFIGAQTQLSNAYGKIYEEIGKLVTQNPVIISSMKSLTDIFVSTASYIEENRENIFLFAKAMGIATTAVLGIVGAMKFYTMSFIIATNAVTALGIAARVTWAAVTGPIGIATAAIVGLGAVIFTTIKYWDDIKIKTLEAAAAVLDYAAIATEVFSKGAADGIREKSQALRDQAQAAREAQAATKAEAEERKKSNDQAESEARRQQELTIEKQKRLDEDKKFTLQLVKNAEDRNKISQDELAILQSNADLEREILKDKYDQGQIDYYTYQESLDAIDAEFYEARQSILAEQAQIELEKVQAAREGGLVSQSEYNQARLEIERKYAKDIVVLDNDLAKKRLKSEQDLRKQRELQQRTQLAGTASFFGSLGQIVEQGSEKNFQTAKAFNTAEAIISGVLAVQRAYSAPPGPPWTVPASIAAGIQAAANVAKIKSAKPSFATGGVVGGYNGVSMGSDNREITARTGEMILNGAQQKNLFNSINKGNDEMGSSNVEGLLTRLINAIEAQPITVSIGGQVVVDTLRTELAAGRTF